MVIQPSRGSNKYIILKTLKAETRLNTSKLLLSRGYYEKMVMMVPTEKLLQDAGGWSRYSRLPPTPGSPTSAAENGKKIGAF